MARPLSERFGIACQACELTLPQLWLRYFALGGEAGETELDAYLNGAMTMTPLQHDVLAHAINERLDEIAPVRAPYSVEFAVAEYLAD